MKKRKGYIFTNKKHSNRAAMSLILGVICMLSLFAVVFMTFRARGEAQTGFGVTGILATLFSITGLVLAILPIREGKYYLPVPILGIVLNGLSLAWISLILYMGANV